MWRTCLCFTLGLAGLLPLTARAADKPLPSTGETAAEKLRKALDQVRDLDLPDLPLDRAVNQLRELTGLNLRIDPTAVPPVGPGGAGMGGLPLNMASYGHLHLSGRFHDLPLRTALTSLLRDHNLTHVIVGDTVLITTLDQAPDRQLGQVVSVHVEGKTLRDELKRLARTTGANIVLDARVDDPGRTKLTVQLDEVPLETAVEVLAEEAGLSVVRLHNVLYVTSEARAEKLRKPRPDATPSFTGWRVWPDGNGGFRLTPPGGAGISGGNVQGLGIMGGAGGIMGGFAGMTGGVAQPVPLTPSVPKTKPAEPKKPAKEAPPAKPTIKHDGKKTPAPKDKPQAQAMMPEKRSPRSRRENRAAVTKLPLPLFA